EAAGRLEVDLVVAAEKPNALAEAVPERLLTLPFADPAASVRQVSDYARRYPIAAVVPVDDATTVVGAAIGQALGLRANPMAAVRATRNKLAMREVLARAGVPQPGFAAFGVEEGPAAAPRGPGGPSASPTAPCTPSCASTTRVPGSSSWPRAPSAGCARGPCASARA